MDLKDTYSSQNFKNTQFKKKQMSPDVFALKKPYQVIFPCSFWHSSSMNNTTTGTISMYVPVLHGSMKRADRYD